MAVENASEFADLLRRARAAAGLTQEELAEAAGISARAVSNLERGINRFPHKYTRDLLAEALEVSPEVRKEWDAACQRRQRSTDGAMQAYHGLDGSQRPASLPVPTTRLIGRDTEVEQLFERIRQPDVRLLTVTGPGGVGKTRLCLGVIEALPEEFPDGIYFVELAAVRDHTLVDSAIASTIGLRQARDQSLQETIASYLRFRRVLLVLDNFEHVIDAAPVVSYLLSSCPTLKVLVTSRAALHLQGEHEIALTPLTLPKDSEHTVEDAIQAPAVALFAERARMVRSDFSVNRQNVGDVVAICRRLDGIPLAIELAAARVKVTPPRELMAHLERPLELLTGGARDAPTRQRTLRDTILWSYRLLTPDERRILRQISIFIDGWTLEAAEQVCDPDLDIFAGVSALIDHSLVRQRELADSSARFDMLETIRQFALEQLQEAGEVRRIEERHSDHVARLVERLQPSLFNEEQVSGLERLEEEHGNVRAALARLLECRNAEMGLRIAGALWRFWLVRGNLSEGRRWYGQFLQLAGETVDAKLRATALTGAGILAERQYDRESARELHKRALAIWHTYPASEQYMACWSLLSLGSTAWGVDNTSAERWFEQALTLARELGEPGHVGRALFRLGNLIATQGNETNAVDFWKDALEHAHQVGDLLTIAHASGNIAIAMIDRGEIDEARLFFEESMAIHRALGNKKDIANMTGNMSTWELEHGNLSSALEWAAEGLAVARDLGDDPREIANGLRRVGDVLLRMGDFEGAREHFREGLTLARSMGGTIEIVQLIESIARLLLESGDALPATKLMAATAQNQRLSNIYTDHFWQRLTQKAIDRARTILSSEQFNTAWEAGETLSLDEATELALAELG